MGLTSWKNVNKGGKIIKTDVSIAKNYLSGEELSGLNRLVSMYLDYAENLVRRRMPMKMADWVIRLDQWLKFNEYALLEGKGKVSKDSAVAYAESQFSKYRIMQDKEYKSDFDRFVGNIRNLESGIIIENESSKPKAMLSKLNPSSYTDLIKGTAKVSSSRKENSSNKEDNE